MPACMSFHTHVVYSAAAMAAEPHLPSCWSSEKLSLPSLQSKMKCDPKGYESELILLRNQFNSSVELFHKQAALNFASITGVGGDHTVAKDLGHRALFLEHVTPFYPNHLADFPQKLADLIRRAARTLPSVLRCYLTQALILLVNRKASHQGTAASKKKKNAKLQRAIRSMKRKQCLSHERNDKSYYSPLNHLKDAQGFAEKLFSRLQKCNEKHEVKIMMLKLVARTAGLHRLILLKFYGFLQTRIQTSSNQPHQRNILDLLAAVVLACHDVVPPDTVKPLLKEIVNKFVLVGSPPEAITVGIKAVRDICERMPLVMNEDLLQDLAPYKKSHEKAVSSAARSLISLFREVVTLVPFYFAVSMRVKKDRGRPIDPNARPNDYGEVNFVTDVPGAEFLHIGDNDDKEEYGDSDGSDDHDQENDAMSITNDDDENHLSSSDNSGSDNEEVNEDNVGSEDEDEISSDCESCASDADEEDDVVAEHEEEDDLRTSSDDEIVGTKSLTDSAKKRKLRNFNGKLVTGDTSLRALKKLAGTTWGLMPCRQMAFSLTRTSRRSRKKRQNMKQQEHWLSMGWQNQQQLRKS